MIALWADLTALQGISRDTDESKDLGYWLCRYIVYFSLWIGKYLTWNNLISIANKPLSCVYFLSSGFFHYLRSKNILTPLYLLCRYVNSRGSPTLPRASSFRSHNTILMVWAVLSVWCKKNVDTLTYLRASLSLSTAVSRLGSVSLCSASSSSAILRASCMLSARWQFLRPRVHVL